MMGEENDIFRVAGGCYDLELVSQALELGGRVHKVTYPTLPPLIESGEEFGILDQPRLEAKKRVLQQRSAEIAGLKKDAKLQDMIHKCAYKKMKDKEDVSSRIHQQS